MGCCLGRDVSASVVSESKKEKEEEEDLKVESVRRVEAATSRVDSNIDVRNCSTQEKQGSSQRLKADKRRSRANPRLRNLPNHLSGEQVVAGWPSWLAAVAGEAINGWIPRRADSFEKIDKVGTVFLFLFYFIFMRGFSLHAPHLKLFSS